MSIIGPYSSGDKAFTGKEKTQRHQLMKRRLVPAAGVADFSSKLRGPAELQPGNCNEILEGQRVWAD
jgi:hypothetical protein